MPNQHISNNTSQVRWNHESKYCPWGHVKSICMREKKYTSRKYGKERQCVAYVCRIHSMQMEHMKGKKRADAEGRDYKPKPITKEMQAIIDAAGADTTPTADLGPFQVHFKLICGHTMYSRGTSFIPGDLENWWCYRCASFQEVLTYCQVMQANIELTPLSRRHKLARLEKEGLQESPPSSAAVIPDRWAGVDPAVVARNNMATHSGGNSSPRPTLRGKKVA